METRATTWRAPGRPTLRRGDPAPAAVPETSPEPEGEALLTAVRLALLSVLAFLPVIACRWVFWDDSKNFLANPHFRGLGWTQIAWAWRATLLGVYQPLSWMLLEAEYSAWGLNPRGYHLVSLGLHAANVVALFAVTVAILWRCLPGLAAARPETVHRAAGLAVALFAVHPLRAESVAWVSAQPYLPSSLCGLLAVLAYLKAQEAGRSRRGTTIWLAVTLGLFVVAMLFKTVAISLPLLLLILDVYPLGRLGGSGARSWVGAGVRRVWVEKVPFLVVSLVFVAVAMQVRPRIPADLGSRLASAACAIWFYPAKTLVPLHLRVIYAPCVEASLQRPLYAVCAAGAVAFTAVVVLMWRRWPGLAAAWLSYLVILAPNSGLVRITSSVAADRYSYVASMGLVVLLAGLFCLWAGRRKPDRPRRPAVRLAGAGALAAVVLGLCVLSWFQTATWKAGLMLWTQAVDHGAADSVWPSTTWAIPTARSDCSTRLSTTSRRRPACGPISSCRT
jgi:protein O-mannosyl-transferase